jgi:hypothetical protein
VFTVGDAGPWPSTAMTQDRRQSVPALGFPFDGVSQRDHFSERLKFYCVTRDSKELKTIGLRADSGLFDGVAVRRFLRYMPISY